MNSEVEKEGGMVCENMNPANENQSLNWSISIEKFLSRKELNKLRSWVRKRRDESNRVTWIEWFLIEIGINTGLRVFEITDLQCGDIVLNDELSFIRVRNGKCGKYREVRISKSFYNAIEIFLKWKGQNGEGINSSDYLFISPKTRKKYSTRALQLAFKRCLEGANIPTHHSIHHLRHTYASCLLSSSKNNIRLVQKQLGHASIVTTQVYADVFMSEIENAVENLF